MTDKHLTFGDFQALPRGEEALIYSPPPPPLGRAAVGLAEVQEPRCAGGEARG